MTVKETALKYEQLLKIQPGQEIPAAQASWDNGCDEVFFKVGQDTYVLSGESLPMGKVKVGSTFDFMGQEARVTYKNNEINSTKDGLIQGLKDAGKGTLRSAIFLGAVGGVIGGLVGGPSFTGVLKGAAVGLGIGSVSGGVIGAAYGVIFTGISTATGAFEGQSAKDPNILKAFGR